MTPGITALLGCASLFSGVFQQREDPECKRGSCLPIVAYQNAAHIIERGLVWFRYTEWLNLHQSLSKSLVGYMKIVPVVHSVTYSVELFAQTVFMNRVKTG